MPEMQTLRRAESGRGIFHLHLAMPRRQPRPRHHRDRLSVHQHALNQHRRRRAVPPHPRRLHHRQARAHRKPQPPIPAAERSRPIPVVRLQVAQTVIPLRRDRTHSLRPPIRHRLQLREQHPKQTMRPRQPQRAMPIGQHGGNVIIRQTLLRPQPTEPTVLQPPQPRPRVTQPQRSIRRRQQTANRLGLRERPRRFIHQHLTLQPQQPPVRRAEPQPPRSVLRHRPHHPRAHRRVEQFHLALPPPLHPARPLHPRPQRARPVEKERAHRTWNRPDPQPPGRPLPVRQLQNPMPPRAHPNAALPIARHARRLQPAPRFAQRHCAPAPLLLAGQLPRQRHRPNPPRLVRAHRAQRRERQPRRRALKFHHARTHPVQPAAGGARPHIALRVLRQTHHFTVRGLHPLRPHRIAPEQTIRRRPHPHRATAVLENHPRLHPWTVRHQMGQRLWLRALHQTEHPLARAHPHPARLRRRQLQPALRHAEQRHEFPPAPHPDAPRLREPKLPRRITRQLTRARAGQPLRCREARHLARQHAPRRAIRVTHPDRPIPRLHQRDRTRPAQALRHRENIRAPRGPPDQPAAVQRHPQPSVPRGQQRPQRLPAPRRARRQDHALKAHPIEARQPVERRHPQISLGRLGDARHRVFEQPLLHLPQPQRPLSPRRPRVSTQPCQRADPARQSQEQPLLNASEHEPRASPNRPSNATQCRTEGTSDTASLFCEVDGPAFNHDLPVPRRTRGAAAIHRHPHRHYRPPPTGAGDYQHQRAGLARRHLLAARRHPSGRAGLVGTAQRRVGAKGRTRLGHALRESVVGLPRVVAALPLTDADAVSPRRPAPFPCSPVPSSRFRSSPTG